MSSPTPHGLQTAEYLANTAETDVEFIGANVCYRIEQITAQLSAVVHQLEQLNASLSSLTETVQSAEWRRMNECK